MVKENAGQSCEHSSPIILQTISKQYFSMCISLRKAYNAKWYMKHTRHMPKQMHLLLGSCF